MYFDNAALYPSIQAMAADHNQAIHARQQRGPYFLCGFSFAAHVAWVVRQTLRAWGEKVNLILIFSDADYRIPLSRDNSPIKDSVFERYFDTPSQAVTEQFLDVAAFRQSLLAQARQNMHLHDDFVPTDFDVSVLLLRNCVINDGSLDREKATALHDGRVEPQHGDRFNRFARGEFRVMCVPASNHYAMLKEAVSLTGISAAMENLARGLR